MSLHLLQLAPAREHQRKESTAAAVWGPCVWVLLGEIFLNRPDLTRMPVKR